MQKYPFKKISICNYIVREDMLSFIKARVLNESDLFVRLSFQNTLLFIVILL